MTQGAIGTAVALDRALPKQVKILPTVSLKTPIKPAPSGLIVFTGPQPRVVLRTNPGLSKNVPSGHGLDGCRSREESRLSPGRAVGRSMVFGCPLEGLPAEEHPVHPAENHRMTNSHNHPPKPFPEGEIFHSPGLTRSGYPGWGTFNKNLNPNGVRLTQGAIGTAVAFDRAPPKQVGFRPHSLLGQ